MTDKTPSEPGDWRDRGPSAVEARPTPPPQFKSWRHYLARTTEAERMAWCAEKAKRANRRDKEPYEPTIPWLANKRCEQEVQDVLWFQQKLEDLGLLPLTPDNLRMGVMIIKAEEAERTVARAASPSKTVITKQQVWAILKAAKGRCAYCGSLAVERGPVNPATSKLAPWAQVGRRIGSLDHVRGAETRLDNLAWCCNWCNTWPSERRLLATDHGGYYPKD